jgi:hypothetical protein
MRCRIYRRQGTRCHPPKSFSNVGLGPICPPWIRFLVQFRFMKVEENVCFKIGDRVRIQNAVSKRWDDTGSISEIRDSGRSCYVARDLG